MSPGTSFWRPCMRCPLLRLVVFILTMDLQRAGAEGTFEEDIRPILERSCLKCHGGEKVKGSVDFATIRSEAEADMQIDLWQTVV